METHSRVFFESSGVNQQIDRPVLVLCDFSTPANLGSAIRLAVNVNALKVIVVGNDSLRNSKIKKTAGAAFDHIEVEFIEADQLLSSLPEGYQLVALETASGATNVFQTTLPAKIALLLGNEKRGIDKAYLGMCSQCVFIPMPGAIKSMNVTHAGAVGLFEWYRQQSDTL